MLKLLFGREPPRGTASGTVTRPANLLPDIAVTPASAADVTPGTERARAPPFAGELARALARVAAPFGVGGQHHDLMRIEAKVDGAKVAERSREERGSKHQHQ